MTRKFLACSFALRSLRCRVICEQGQASKPWRVGEMIRTGEVLLTEEGDGDGYTRGAALLQDSTSGRDRSKAGLRSVL